MVMISSEPQTDEVLEALSWGDTPAAMVLGGAGSLARNVPGRGCARATNLTHLHHFSTLSKLAGRPLRGISMTKEIVM
jgi:hypothetical protein